MVVQERFTPEEWQAVVAGPVEAGMLIAFAQPQGPFGLAHELRAIYDATVTGVINAPSELVREVGAVLARQKGEGGAADQLKASAEQAKAHSPGDPQAFFLGQITRAAALVGQKAPADAPAYKAWLVACAEKTAQAAREGGFFGFGGVQVTPRRRPRSTASALPSTPPGSGRPRRPRRGRPRPQTLYRPRPPDRPPRPKARRPRAGRAGSAGAPGVDDPQESARRRPERGSVQQPGESPHDQPDAGGRQQRGEGGLADPLDPRPEGREPHRGLRRTRDVDRQGTRTGAAGGRAVPAASGSPEDDLVPPGAPTPGGSGESGSGVAPGGVNGTVASIGAIAVVGRPVRRAAPSAPGSGGGHAPRRSPSARR